MEKRIQATEHPLVASRRLLEEAEGKRRQKNFGPAKKICEDLLARYPDYHGALHTMGLILADSGNSRQALSYLAQANAYFPENPNTLVALSTVYLQIGARDKAIECARKALDLSAGSAPLFVTLGKILDEEKDYDGACQAYMKALTIEPGWTEAELLLAFAYENLGDVRSAYKILSRRLKAGDHSLSVIAALLNLPTAEKLFFDPDLFSRVPVNESNFNYMFARAHFHIRQGNHSKGWDDLVVANRLKAATMNEQRKANRTWQEQSLNYVTNFGLTAAHDDPNKPFSLFILGPSRSGKTTAESIVSSSPTVNRGYENSIPAQAARKGFRKAGYPTSFQWPLLPRGVESYCNEEYQKLLQSRSSTAQVFTNTNPARVHDVYRIASVIPNTRAIFIKRSSSDSLYKIYYKNYAQGNFYAYDLADIQDHIQWYEHMSEAICRRFPDKCILLDYEKIIDDPQIVISAARELCPAIGEALPRHSIDGDVGCSEPFVEKIRSAIQNSHS